MKQIATIPLEKIEKIEIYVTKCKKTMSQVVAEKKADYTINGGMWNSDMSACPLLKADGSWLSTKPWTAYGYGWDSGPDIKMTAEWNNKNFIACTPLILSDQKISKLSYDNAQGGVRGRTALGIKNGNFVMYCSQDKTSDSKSPERLRDYLFSYGCESAIMLDGGGSSMCNFKGATIKGDSRKVHNWILVYLKKEEIELPEEDKNGITKRYMTKNPCYTKPVKINPKGIMVHSTATPGVMAEKFANSWDSENAEVSVHYFVDDTKIIHTLPDGYKAWHCGSSANNTHISFEICEPEQMRLVYKRALYNTTPQMSGYDVKMLQQELKNLGYHTGSVDGYFGPATKESLMKYQSANGLDADGSCGPATWAKLQSRSGSLMNYNANSADTKNYFENIWKNAVKLCVYLCKTYGFKASDILCHSEGYQKGIASNHADVMHWFPLHGKDMNAFRAAVESELNGDEVVVDKDQPDSWAEKSWEKAKNKIGTDGNPIVDGTRPKDGVTRQELSVILDRLGLLD